MHKGHELLSLSPSASCHPAFVLRPAAILYACAWLLIPGRVDHWKHTSIDLDFSKVDRAGGAAAAVVVAVGDRALAPAAGV